LNAQQRRGEIPTPWTTEEGSQPTGESGQIATFEKFSRALKVGPKIWTMAPRLFPRNPKKPPDATMQPDADADSQLFSKDLAFGHVVAGEPAPDQTTAPAIPALQSQDRQQPGWYRDTDDPGLMRYWDGFHFTGQAKRPSEDGC